MKVLHIVITLSIFFFSSMSFADTPFCEGFKEGWIAGCTERTGSRMSCGTGIFSGPCPSFGMNQNDRQHGWQMGYQKGKSGR